MIPIRQKPKDDPEVQTISGRGYINMCDSICNFELHDFEVSTKNKERGEDEQTTRHRWHQQGNNGPQGVQCW